jgi:hypothetical protein
VRGALVVTGVLLPVLAVISLRRLDAVDFAVELRAPQIELLRSLPIFAPLPLVFARAARLPARPGERPGRRRRHPPGRRRNRFYVAAAGRLGVMAASRAPVAPL